MLNLIWLGLLLVGVLVAGITGQFAAINQGALGAAKSAVMDVALPLCGAMTLWLGMVRLAEKAGLIQQIARFIRPILVRLFSDVPPDHPAMGSIVMNMAANMLGVSNAATPLGLRAMSQLNELNTKPGVATNAMCTFLAINTSSIQLVPATAINILAINGSKNPTGIVGSTMIATFFATVSAIVAVKFLQRLGPFRWEKQPETSTRHDHSVFRRIERSCGSSVANGALGALGSGGRYPVFSGALYSECVPLLVSRRGTCRFSRSGCHILQCTLSLGDPVSVDFFSVIRRRPENPGLHRIHRGCERRFWDHRAHHSLPRGNAGGHRGLSRFWSPQFIERSSESGPELVSVPAGSPTDGPDSTTERQRFDRCFNRSGKAAGTGQYPQLYGGHHLRKCRDYVLRGGGLFRLGRDHPNQARHSGRTFR